MHIFDRIKEERERLNYNQTDFAAVAKATRKTLFNWESGSGSPSAEALAAWAAVGLDVLYVVTGARTRPTHLPADEQMLLDCYREWSPEVKKRELRRAMGVSPEGVTESPQAATTPGAPTHQIGGAHSQHNSGDNAVQIGGNSGGVTQNIRAPVRGGVAGGNIYKGK
ncbi:MAG: helix-turn-helix domain-containing protein [Rhodoferax sp.]|nr:helix-turn-helix domain-containing protein [Rhodoferax sp.]MDP3652443.1 helix-turn-helix domain-containing protein [Rhodoferax sp.]